MGGINLDWQSLYEAEDTGWDLGTISPPMKQLIDTLEDKSLKILIPGAGNSYEAEYLFEQGFTEVHVVDIATTPIENLKHRVPNFPHANLHVGDYFGLDGSFDLVLEQTFFCALPPERRRDYSRKTRQLLKQGGRHMGVLFDFPLTEEGPPFGGDAESYRNLFSGYFDIVKLERCNDSIETREGKELYFEFHPIALPGLDFSVVM